MSSIQSVNTIQDVARTIMAKVDRNSDGQLSTDEFASFLNTLLSGATTSSSATAALSSTASTVAATSIGSTGAMKFEGFDLNKVQDTQKSAKYAFLSIAQRTGTMPSSKPDAEQWFNTNVKSQMEALGHKIDWVQGDRFQFTNWQGTFVVDFVRGANSGDPALAWQVE
jgi:hypothetical protein